MVAPTLTLRDATIGVITALPIEFAAAAAMLRCFQQLETNGRIYRVGQVSRRDGRGYHVVSITCLPATGNDNAAIRTRELTHDCPRVSEIILCGIAGAVPCPAKVSEHVRLGDIVVTNERGVVQYDFGRFLESGFHEEPKWFAPSRRLRETSRILESDALMGEMPWNKNLEDGIDRLTSGPDSELRWRRPDEADDELREFDGSRALDYLKLMGLAVRVPFFRMRYDPLPHPLDPNRTPGKPRVFSGVIASANALQKSSRRRNQLRTRYGAKAVEMEGAGLAQAAHAADLPFFVIRGTVDYCNSEKNDRWHYYAALAAAAYTLALLQATTSGSLLYEATDPSTTSALSPQTEVVSPKRETTSTHLTDLEPTVIADAIAKAVSMLEAVVEDDGRTRLSRINSAFETWDIQEALRLGDELSVWLNDNGHRISKSLLYDIYVALARVQVSKGQRATGPSKIMHINLANDFISKAKKLDL